MRRAVLKIVENILASQEAAFSTPGGRNYAGPAHASRAVFFTRIFIRVVISLPKAVALRTRNMTLV
jgi:hypothetical protein